MNFADILASDQSAASEIINKTLQQKVFDLLDNYQLDTSYISNENSGNSDKE